MENNFIIPTKKLLLEWKIMKNNVCILCNTLEDYRLHFIIPTKKLLLKWKIIKNNLCILCNRVEDYSSVLYFCSVIGGCFLLLTFIVCFHFFAVARK